MLYTALDLAASKCTKQMAISLTNSYKMHPTDVQTITGAQSRTAHALGSTFLMLSLRLSVLNGQDFAPTHKASQGVLILFASVFFDNNISPRHADEGQSDYRGKSQLTRDPVARQPSFSLVLPIIYFPTPSILEHCNACFLSAQSSFHSS